MPTENVREMSDIVLRRSLDYWNNRLSGIYLFEDGAQQEETRAMIAEREAEIERRNALPSEPKQEVLPAHLVKLGFGDMALCPGTLHNVPAVFFEPVTAAPVGHRSPYREEMAPGTTAITFANPRSITVLYEMIGRLIEPGRREEVLTLLDRVQELEKAAGAVIAVAGISRVPEIQALATLLTPAAREA